MPKRKAISLFFEISEVEGAVEAARRVVLDLQGGPWPGEPEAARDLLAAGAVLSLVICRLRLVRAAIDGSIDPALLVADHNKVQVSERGVQDIKLMPGSHRRGTR